MATGGYVMNVSLNSKSRLAVKRGGLPSKNWTKCCAAPIANTVMWNFLIEGVGSDVNVSIIARISPIDLPLQQDRDLEWQQRWFWC
jgi:hypothetical protein